MIGSIAKHSQRQIIILVMRHEFIRDQRFQGCAYFILATRQVGLAQERRYSGGNIAQRKQPRLQTFQSIKRRSSNRAQVSNHDLISIEFGVEPGTLFAARPAVPPLLHNFLHRL